MDPEQAMAQVDKATYVPMAMICACTAAQAPADTQPMYLKGLGSANIVTTTW